MAKGKVLVRLTDAYEALRKLTIDADWDRQEALVTMQHALLQFALDQNIDMANVLSIARTRFMSEQAPIASVARI